MSRQSFEASPELKKWSHLEKPYIPTDLKKHKHNLCEEELTFLRNIIPSNHAKFIEIHWQEYGNFNTLYRPINIPKKNGGTRTIQIPHPSIKNLQSKISYILQDSISVHNSCHGFCRNRSIFTNALVHVGQEMVVNIDIKDFFPSIKIDLVKRLFEQQLTRNVDFFAELTTRYKKLPQGAPTSPYIANLVFYEFDKSISDAVEDRNGKYTRYADDITISGDVGIHNILPKIRKILARGGFRLNNKKTRIQRKGYRQEVTGLTVNEKVSVPRHIRRKFRSAVHYYKTGKQPVWNGKPMSPASLEGYINYLISIHPELIDKYKYSFDGYTATGFDPQGYNRDGYKRNGYNRQGYDRNGYNREGFDKNGYNKRGFDEEGYDCCGYDTEGYDENGINKIGYKKYGFSIDGFNALGYNYNGYHRDGFDRRGYDPWGCDRNGNHKFLRSNRVYDLEGYDKYGYNQYGYDRNGYDRGGYDKYGYDVNGYDRDAFNRKGYDSSGYDRNGYDRLGYNRRGYNRNGLDKDGMPRKRLK